MIDDRLDPRLEARLRLDSAGDPPHLVGRLWTAVPVERYQPRRFAVLQPVAALGLVAALAVAGLLGLRIATEGTQPTTQPSPTPTAPVMTPARLAQVARTWQPPGAGNAPVAITVLGSVEQAVSYVEGPWPGSPQEASSARIGEISRLYVIAATARVAGCADGSTMSSAACSTPPAGAPRLTLDDAVATWYAGWTPGDGTTVRQLMTGSSGLQPIATSLDELADRIAADPAADWSRSSRLGAAIAAPRLFAAGSQVNPVDTEAMVLEEIIVAATGQTLDAVIPTSGYPPFTTSLADQPPQALIAGERGNGSTGTVSDLDPALLTLGGNAWGVAASSIDLAGYALTIWKGSDAIDAAGVAMLTDAAGGYRAPYGATSSCPCDGTPIVLSMTGNAVGWSALMAYDVTHNTAIGVVTGREMEPGELQALLDLLVNALS